jgi:hypothetical protein
MPPGSRADIRHMSNDRNLEARIAELEQEERALSASRRRLHDRIALYGASDLESRERELSARRKELHAEIDELRSQLGAA